MVVPEHKTRFSLSFALLTALTLAGGLALALVGGNRIFETFNGHMSGFLSGLAAFPVVLLVVFGAGGLWGLATARLTGADPWRLTVTTALTYGGVILLAGILLELVFGLLGAWGSVVRIPIHIAFTLVFAPAAGLIAALCSQKLLSALEINGSGFNGLFQIGLAAAAGFLVVNLVMLALGWQVGGLGAAERYTMITVMLSSNTGAALAGGFLLGRLLSGDHVGGDC
jgi:hypothetical protein